MDENPDRALWIGVRRTLLSFIALIEQRWDIEKPTLYLPQPLHDKDEREVGKHFRIVRESRP